MDKLLKELLEKRAKYNETLKETRSLAETGEDVTKQFEELDELRQEILDLEERKLQFEKLNQLDAIEEDEEKRFSPKLSNGSNTMREITNEDPRKEVRDGINAYLRHGELRESVTTINQEVIIPKDISYIPQKEVQTVYDLSANFNKTDVGTKSGSYPILENPTDALPSVEELAKNPELAAPKFHEVKWEVGTYRGALPISQEAISDAQTDLTALISNQISQRMLNTTNKFIAAKLKAFEKVTPGAKDDLVDSIKEILNVKLDPAYVPQIICTQSLYQTLDTLKDKQGQYIFHRDVISASGGTLLGVPVVKVPDTLLGEKVGDQVAFIGDRRAVTVFDRNQASVVWAENGIYGRYLMGVLRFDVEVTDKKAGFLLSINDTPKP
ncbi:phage major capsid protein, HK97 family [Enterococcus faecalis]|uniref:phage major capsid protein n=1 Tax=Enterococcus TaxID=1350 RepID=UPI00045AA064|nr:phage major capsid protein [Enterococcus faecalis]KAJ80414.1 Phage capsid protein [Enterococcus faecalis MTUP9]SDN56738.1 phage major capsid protein, HK97 family [Enterococcus faecalis]